MTHSDAEQHDREKKFPPSDAAIKSASTKLDNKYPEQQGDKAIEQPYKGYIILAQNQHDLEGKRRCIDRGDARGFFTITQFIATLRQGYTNTIKEKDELIKTLIEIRDSGLKAMGILHEKIASLQAELERVKQEKQYLRDIITEKRHNKEDGDPLGTMVFDHNNQREVFVSFLPDEDIFVDNNRVYSIEQIEQALQKITNKAIEFEDAAHMCSVLLTNLKA